jgi:hypothetical protein
VKRREEAPFKNKIMSALKQGSICGFQNFNFFPFTKINKMKNF